MNEFLKELADLLDKHEMELIATDEQQVSIESKFDNLKPICLDGYITAEKLRTANVRLRLL